MITKKKYLHIKTMSQLKIERSMLDSDIKIKEALFDIQYSRFRESIKIGNLVSSVISNFSMVIPLIVKATNTFKSFYHFIIAQFKSEKRDQHYSPEESNQQENNISQERNDSQETLNSEINDTSNSF